MDEQYPGKYYTPPEANMIYNLQEMMMLISWLEHVAIDHGHALISRSSGWTASPINVSSFPNIPNIMYS